MTTTLGGGAIGASGPFFFYFLSFFVFLLSFLMVAGGWKVEEVMVNRKHLGRDRASYIDQ